MTAKGTCPDCDRPRDGRGRCPCGSFAAPVEHDRNAVSVEDRQWLAGQLRDGAPMADICRELDLDSATVREAHHVHQEGIGRGASIALAPADNGTGCYKRKNCSKCGRRFTTTPRRRLLCYPCFRNADDSGFDPGDGDSSGDLREISWGA